MRTSYLECKFFEYQITVNNERHFSGVVVLGMAAYLYTDEDQCPTLCFEYCKAIKTRFKVENTTFSLNLRHLQTSV